MVIQYEVKAILQAKETPATDLGTPLWESAEATCSPLYLVKPSLTKPKYNLPASELLKWIQASPDKGIRGTNTFPWPKNAKIAVNTMPSCSVDVGSKPS